MRAEAWAGLGSCVTAVVAIAGAGFAAWQVWELRKTRERQTQPNVVAFVQPNRKVYQFLDLVVANYGQTPAYHVKLDFPPLTVTPYMGMTGDQVAHLHVPDEIAVLAPSQEWRTVWDAATTRHPKRDEIGSRFEGVVHFEDSRGNKFDNPGIFDWDTHFHTNFVADNPDESAKEIAGKLSDISSILRSYKSEHDGIWIYPVPIEDERAHREAETARQKAMSERLHQMIHGAQHQQPESPEQSERAPGDSASESSARACADE